MTDKIEVSIYWGYDDDGSPLIDEDSIREEFENKLKDVRLKKGCDGEHN
jgi:hypothetical protein